MEWETIARVVAPTLATALTGPLGGVAASIVGNVLLPDQADKDRLTPLAVMDRIATMTSPADVAKLREAEQALQRFEADNKFRFTQMDAESQQNARTMRLSALASNNPTTDRLAWLSLISFLVVASLVLLLVALILGKAIDFSASPEAWAAVSGLIGSVLGYFSANANQVISFYFGSSAGSAAKTDHMAQQTTEFLSFIRRQPPNPPGAPSSPPRPPSPPSKAQVMETPDGARTVVAVGEPEAQQLLHAAVGSPAQRAAQADQGWRNSVAFVLTCEGGFSNDPADRGGPTNRGITLRALEHFRGIPVTEKDVRDLTEAEARQIYQQDYWNPVHGDELPAGVDLCVFDTAVLCGPGQAGQFLQAAVGLNGADVDGRIGPRTLQAVMTRTPSAIIEAMTKRRMAFHQDQVAKSPDQKRFLQGWLDRTQAMRQSALRMAGVPDSTPETVPERAPENVLVG